VRWGENVFDERRDGGRERVSKLGGKELHTCSRGCGVYLGVIVFQRGGVELWDLGRGKQKGMG